VARPGTEATQVFVEYHCFGDDNHDVATCLGGAPLGTDFDADSSTVFRSVRLGLGEQASGGKKRSDVRASRESAGIFPCPYDHGNPAIRRGFRQVTPDFARLRQYRRG
jgi:hypothetical protein